MILPLTVTISRHWIRASNARNLVDILCAPTTTHISTLATISAKEDDEWAEAPSHDMHFPPAWKKPSSQIIQYGPWWFFTQ
jgi:hypothetical protein